jgi:hypothetical protein
MMVLSGMIGLIVLLLTKAIPPEYGLCPMELNGK